MIGGLIVYVYNYQYIYRKPRHIKAQYLGSDILAQGLSSEKTLNGGPPGGEQRDGQGILEEPMETAGTPLPWPNLESVAAQALSCRPT